MRPGRNGLNLGAAIIDPVRFQSSATNDHYCDANGDPSFRSEGNQPIPAERRHRSFSLVFDGEVVAPEQIGDPIAPAHEVRLVV